MKHSILRLNDFNLILPFAFLVLVMLEQYGFVPWSTSSKVWSLYIIKIMALNHLHVFFTFSMLAFLPELKDWQRATFGSHSAFNLGVALAFTVFFFCSLVSEGLILESKNMTRHMGLLISVYTLHHLMAQSFGLASIAGGKAVGPYSTRVSTLILFSLVGCLFVFRIWNNEFAIGFQFYNYAEFSVFCISMIFCLGLILSHLLSQSHEANKTGLFLTRIILFPLLPYSHSALIGIAAIHGIEYLQVFSSHIDKSAIEVRKRRFMLYLTFNVCLVGAIFLFFKKSEGPIGLFFSENVQSLPLYLKILPCISLAIGLTHAYCDHMIFRKQNSGGFGMARQFLALGTSNSMQNVRNNL